MTYINLGSHIAGPVLDELSEEYIKSLERFKLTPELEKHFEGKKQVVEGVDFVFKPLIRREGRWNKITGKVVVGVDAGHQSDAIAFVEWITDTRNGIYENSGQFETKPWIYKGQKYTTAEMYNLYKQQP